MNMTIIYVLIAFGVFAFIIGIIWFITRQQRRRVEAVEEHEGRRFQREMVIPFDQEAAEVLERRIVRCSQCEEEVSPYDEECPHCGARLSSGIYECSNCGKEVDPRDKECPHCGEILLPDPYVCPKCFKPAEEDARKCDICGASFWSPILLDEATLKKKSRRGLDEEEKEVEPEPEPDRPTRRRAYR